VEHLQSSLSGDWRLPRPDFFNTEQVTALKREAASKIDGNTTLAQVMVDTVSSKYELISNS
jgi:hypothetical protein